MLMSLIEAFLPASAAPVPTPIFGAADVLRRALPFERSALDIQKLLYIAQLIHLGRHDAPMFPDRFNASMMGPVNPRLHRHLKFDRKSVDPVHAAILPQSALDILAEVARDYGRLSGAKLVAITHGRVSAWANHFKPHSATLGPYTGLPISHTAMAAEYHEKASAK